ncbi:MAG TPA: diphthine--ammonia ligase [Firmicutes bacterium]|nr:diphthine--ammonia ligase [Bacillota bacterium]
MKCILSFSAGKDSVLTLHKLKQAGHEVTGLLVMMNRALGRSWFHGIDPDLLAAIAESLGLPLLLCESAGEDYHLAMEEGLRRAAAGGAEACAFGDIDAEDNAAWCRARCEAAGLKPLFPLWHRDRLENTREAIALGYRCVVKCVRNRDLPPSLLGRALDEAVLREMAERGIDVCGENGEYHTVVLDGPLFRQPVPYECRELLDFGNITAVNIVRDAGREAGAWEP